MFLNTMKQAYWEKMEKKNTTGFTTAVVSCEQRLCVLLCSNELYMESQDVHISVPACCLKASVKLDSWSNTQGSPLIIVEMEMCVGVQHIAVSSPGNPLWESSMSLISPVD